MLDPTKFVTSCLVINQDRKDRSITLPPKLYKAGRDPHCFQLIISNTIHRDTGHRVFVTLMAGTYLHRVLCHI
jgi:hypothetical protein